MYGNPLMLQVALLQIPSNTTLLFARPSRVFFGRMISVASHHPPGFSRSLQQWDHCTTSLSEQDQPGNIMRLHDIHLFYEFPWNIKNDYDYNLIAHCHWLWTASLVLWRSTPMILLRGNDIIIPGNIGFQLNTWISGSVCDLNFMLHVPVWPTNFPCNNRSTPPFQKLVAFPDWLCLLKSSQSRAKEIPAVASPTADTEAKSHGQGRQGPMFFDVLQLLLCGIHSTHKLSVCSRFKWFKCVQSLVSELETWNRCQKSASG